MALAPKENDILLLEVETPTALFSAYIHSHGRGCRIRNRRIRSRYHNRCRSHRHGIRHRDIRHRIRMSVRTLRGGLQ